MKVWIASDHAGFDLKNALISRVPEVQWVDLGPKTKDRTDYPDWADPVALQIQNSGGWGLLICGSGQGMAIRANRFKKVRAALCWNEEVAELARHHNDANVLCLGSRWTNADQARNILNVFLKTQFEGGRHAPRVEKLDRA